jgi:hypothetical protein
MYTFFYNKQTKINNNFKGTLLHVIMIIFLLLIIVFIVNLLS